MNSESCIKNRLSQLFTSQKFAVIATSSQNRPYTSLVAFAVTSDLRKLYFFTRQATRKFSNIHSNPRIAVMIDNRSNKDSDIHDAIGVTITGTSRVLTNDKTKHPLTLFLKKHPQMEDFARAPTSALIEVTIDHYYIVTQFQKVMELHVNKDIHN